MRACTLRVVVLVGVAGLGGSCRAVGAGELVGDLPAVPQTGPTGDWIRASSCTTAYRPSSFGHVAYASESDKHVHRIEARPGAIPEDVSFELNKFSGGEDGFINLSPDGQWMVIGTSRFGCGDSGCMALVAQDACSAQVILGPDGTPIQNDGTAALGTRADGDLVLVFPNQGGPHGRDLFASVQHAGQWSAPLLLTGSSPHKFHQQPALSSDGARVLMDCGPDSGSGTGTGICEAATDASSFHTVMMPADGPGHYPDALMQQSDYRPDDTNLVFEASWNEGDEQVWRLQPPQGPLGLVNTELNADGIYTYGNDNAPCVLPDGRIVSLWLGRFGNVNGGHELKVMNADGTEPAMLVIDVNVLDVGLGCGK
jgi:hypothetical protein